MTDFNHGHILPVPLPGLLPRCIPWRAGRNSSFLSLGSLLRELWAKLLFPLVFSQKEPSLWPLISHCWGKRKMLGYGELIRPEQKILLTCLFSKGILSLIRMLTKILPSSGESLPEISHLIPLSYSIKLFISWCIVFNFFLATPVACRSFLTRNQTWPMASTWAIAVTTLDPIPTEEFHVLLFWCAMFLWLYRVLYICIWIGVLVFSYIGYSENVFSPLELLLLEEQQDVSLYVVHVKLCSHLVLCSSFLLKHIPMYILLSKLSLPCSPREAIH